MRLVAAAAAQQGKDQLAGNTLEDEQGHVAVLLAVVVEQRSLLSPVGVEGGVVFLCLCFCLHYKYT